MFGVWDVLTGVPGGCGWARAKGMLMLVPRMARRVGTMMKSSRRTPAKLLWDLDGSGVSVDGGSDDRDQSRSNATMQVKEADIGSVHEERFIS